MSNCRTGAAYICEDWTKEKDWYKRKRQTYCYKCGKPIKYNDRTRNWRHIKCPIQPRLNEEIKCPSK